MSTSTADGTRVSLIFPPQSLWRSEEVTLTVVDAVEQAPFASSPIAVHISPEHLPLRHPAVLQIEPGRRSTFDASGEITGFAVRGGTELTLYPAGHHEVAGVPGRYRMAMALARLGTYGFASVTPQEAAAIASRKPSDLASRMEQQIALAFGTAPPGPAQASREPRWELIPSVHAQGGVSLFIYELVKQLLEYYRQVVEPKFDLLPVKDCRSEVTFDAIRTYQHWRASIELLMPMERDEELLKQLDYKAIFEKLVAQREEMLGKRGYTPAQIAEINRAIGEFRDEFDRLKAGIDPRIVAALQGEFTALHRCCMKQPEQGHLDRMVLTAQFGDLNGYVPVDPEPMQKISECACMVGSNQPGAPERFTGTVSYEETAALDKTEKRGGRTNVNAEKLHFQHSWVLTGWNGGIMLATGTVSGALSRSTSTTDDHGTCVVHGEGELAVAGKDTDTETVHVGVNPQQGTYTLSVSRVPLEGTGRRRQVWNVKGPACGKFNKPRDEMQWTSQGISPQAMTDGTVEGKLDPGSPHVLKGSRVFEQPDRFYGTTRTGTLKWEINRCRR